MPVENETWAAAKDSALVEGLGTGAPDELPRCPAVR